MTKRRRSALLAVGQAQYAVDVPVAPDAPNENENGLRYNIGDA